MFSLDNQSDLIIQLQEHTVRVNSNRPTSRTVYLFFLPSSSCDTKCAWELSLYCFHKNWKIVFRNYLLNLIKSIHKVNSTGLKCLMQSLKNRIFQLQKQSWMAKGALSRYFSTVEPLLMDTSLIQTPPFYGQFSVSQQNYNIFS